MENQIFFATLDLLYTSTSGIKAKTLPKTLETKFEIFNKRYRNSKGQQLEHGVYQAGKLPPRYNVSHS
jgi:hypothetical protein